MGRMGLSSNVLQSPMQVAGFAPRNGRGSVEKKRRWSAQLQAFSLLSRAPKGPGEMGYKLAVPTYTGDQAGTRWPLYALTTNITYNNLNPYFSPEYQGQGTELRPVFQISHTNGTGRWEYQLFSQPYEPPNVSQSLFNFQVVLLLPLHFLSQLCSV